MKKLIFILILLPLMISCTDNNNKAEKILSNADSLLQAGNTDKAIMLLERINGKSLTGADARAKYCLLLTKAYNTLGKVLSNDSLIDFSIKYFEKTKNHTDLARSYYYKGMCMLDRGDFENGVILLKKAESEEKLSSDPSLRQYIYINLSHVNLEFGNYKTALRYSLKALENAEKRNNTIWMCVSLDKTASCYYFMNKKDSAELYMSRIIPLLEKINDKEMSSMFLNNIGLIWYEKGLYEKAEPMFRQAFNLLDVPTTRINLAKVCYDRGKTEVCDTILAKALEGANFEEKAEIYQFMAEKAEKENRPEEANIFHKKEKIMQDSALARKKTEEMLSLQNEYDNMKKDERTGHRIGMIIVISASALLFFAISSVVLFRRRANSTRRQITEIRKETDKYQRELENAERTSRGDKKEIERLRKKLEQGEARLSAILDRGKDLYDSVKLDGNVSRWSKDDFEAVVEYLRAKMPDEVRMIEETHTKLTAYATFFLLLSATGTDAANTARIMGISQGAVRTMRHRLKKKENTATSSYKAKM